MGKLHQNHTKLTKLKAFKGTEIGKRYGLIQLTSKTLKQILTKFNLLTYLSWGRKNRNRGASPKFTCLFV